MFVSTVDSALYSFSPSLDFGTPYLGKGLGYIGIAVALILIWLLVRYKVRQVPTKKSEGS